MVQMLSKGERRLYHRRLMNWGRESCASWYVMLGSTQICILSEETTYVIIRLASAGSFGVSRIRVSQTAAINISELLSTLNFQMGTE